jgi:hypothetical protein
VGLGGASFTLHHQTEIAFGPGPVARLAAGRLFVKSAPGLTVETSAGTITPIGTEFAVAATGDAARVAVREGSVRLANVLVKKGMALDAVRGKAPGAPVRVAPAEFAWADQAAAEKSLMLYPGARKTGVVMSAVHATATDETHLAAFASGVAEKLGVSSIAGFGWVEWRLVVLPGRNPEEKSLHEEYLRMIREAAGGPVARLAVVLQEKSLNDPSPLVVECGAAGFTREEEERLKRDFDAVVEKHGPSLRLRLACDLTDPSYEVDGAKVAFDASPAAWRRGGVFKADVTARGLRIRVPRACRYDPKARAAYEAIFAEWIERIK